jgi:hypothetical protein
MTAFGWLFLCVAIGIAIIAIQGNNPWTVIQAYFKGQTPPATKAS